MEECYFTKFNTPPWVFFTFFKLYKWCQIAQGTTYNQWSFCEDLLLTFTVDSINSFELAIQWDYWKFLKMEKIMLLHLDRLYHSS